jgi:hypothetical protein
LVAKEISGQSTYRSCLLLRLKWLPSQAAYGRTLGDQTAAYQEINTPSRRDGNASGKSPFAASMDRHR